LCAEVMCAGGWLEGQGAPYGDWELLSCTRPSDWGVMGGRRPHPQCCYNGGGSSLWAPYPAATALVHGRVRAPICIGMTHHISTSAPIHAAGRLARSSICFYGMHGQPSVRNGLHKQPRRPCREGERWAGYPDPSYSAAGPGVVARMWWGMWQWWAVMPASRQLPAGVACTCSSAGAVVWEPCCAQAGELAGVTGRSDAGAVLCRMAAGVGGMWLYRRLGVVLQCWQ
jgi:hypothetical protein